MAISVVAITKITNAAGSGRTVIIPELSSCELSQKNPLVKTGKVIDWNVPVKF